ncbi:MAG: transcription termination/antitermination protein NusG [Gemmataceae bacterium]
MTDETLHPESNPEGEAPEDAAEEVRAEKESDDVPAENEEADEADEAVVAEKETEAEAAESAAAGSNGSTEGPSNKQWYVVKVQSGREESIKEAIEKRVKIEGLEDFFGQIIIPVERVTEMRRNKRITRERKLYPGYLMVEVEFNDRILYLFRETSGVGDFVGGGVSRPPSPMSQREVDKMLQRQPGAGPETVVPGKAPFSVGDSVKVRDGTFSGMEGVVKDVLEAKGLVVVELTIFGRPVPVELEYWQVEN